MPRMTVHMFGVMFFDLCDKDEEATVLLPDGTKGHGPQIPPHYASLFVEASACKEFHGWEPRWHELPNVTGTSNAHMVQVLEFRLDEFCVVQFPTCTRMGKVDTKPLRTALLHLSDIDDAFAPDLKGNGSIARVDIKSGKLGAFTFNRNANAVQWMIRSGDAPLEIKAGTGRRLVLNESPHSEFGAEVVFANAPDFLSARPAPSSHKRGGHAHDGHDRHFGLFRKIDTSRNRNKPLNFPSHRTDIRFESNAMAYFHREAEVDGACTPPCCIKPGGKMADATGGGSGG